MQRVGKPVVLVFGLLLLLGAGVLSMPGSIDTVAGWASVIQRSLISGGLALAWLAGALGLGSLGTTLWSDVTERHVRSALQWSFGIAIAMLLAQVTGQLTTHSAAAWGPVFVGIALLGRQTVPPPRHRVRVPIVSWWMLLAVPALSLFVVACCLPPGTLWASEAHGYDVLSYHLQLPKEWLALGHIRPLNHNVYSFLPGGMEAVYTQLAAMGSIGGHRDLGVDLITPIYAAQFLHTGITLLAALTIGAIIRARFGSAPAWITTAAMLSVPWVVVTGSEAYNEGAVLLGFAGALAAIITGGLSGLRRGILIGVLLGMAVSAKPTAALLVAPALAIGVLVLRPRREWTPIALATALLGVLSCAPWLVRNWLACGNPIFPYATDQFGSDHWTAEQVARWHAGHSISISLSERLGRLLSQPYGLFHAQWSWFAPVVVIAAAAALWCRDQRRIAIALLLGMVTSIVAWLTVGHLQSRFLLPLVVPGALLIGLGFGMPTIPAWARFVSVLGAVAVLTFFESSVRIFLLQQDDRPNAGLVGGVEALSGEWYADAWVADRKELKGTLGTAAELNCERRVFQATDALTDATSQWRAWRIYLFGDATPLYLASDPVLHGEIVYHTTWDAGPLSDVLRSFPDDPAVWIEALKRDGITHVLINYSELRRLHASHWYDPAVTQEVAERLGNILGPPLTAWGSPAQGLYRVPIAESR